MSEHQRLSQICFTQLSQEWWTLICTRAHTRAFTHTQSYRSACLCMNTFLAMWPCVVTLPSTCRSHSVIPLSVTSLLYFHSFIRCYHFVAIAVACLTSFRRFVHQFHCNFHCSLMICSFLSSFRLQCHSKYRRLPLRHSLMTCFIFFKLYFVIVSHINCPMFVHNSANVLLTAVSRCSYSSETSKKSNHKSPHVIDNLSCFLPSAAASACVRHVYVHR